MTELANLTSLEDAYIFIDAIIKKLPDQLDLIYKYFYQTNKFTNCNMFITSKSNFDEYCEFLFGILSDVESRIKTNGYTRLKRVLGYLSEPLLGFWIQYKHLKVKMVNVSAPEEVHMKKNGIKCIIRYNTVFFARTFSLNKTKNPVFFEEWVLNGLRQDGIFITNPT